MLDAGQQRVDFSMAEELELLRAIQKLETAVGLLQVHQSARVDIAASQAALDSDSTAEEELPALRSEPFVSEVRANTCR
jgi:hypothetical protein